jgi:DNA invertase Pin-like site-specific DNA recombinase
LQFDLRSSAQGQLIASLMAALAEFERDLLRELVRSRIAAARKREVVFGQLPAQGGPIRFQSAQAGWRSTCDPQKPDRASTATNE